MRTNAARIHLTGSARDPGDDMPYLLSIIQTLHEFGTSVALNWVETAHHKAQTDGISTVWDWDEIVANNMNAIHRSSAVIIEYTKPGFFQGFQAAIALERRLPVLIVSRNLTNNMPIAGIHNKLLTVKHYDSKAELDGIVRRFLQNITQPTHSLDLAEKTQRFLRGEALLTGKSESEIIDELVGERLNK